MSGTMVKCIEWPRLTEYRDRLPYLRWQHGRLSSRYGRRIGQEQATGSTALVRQSRAAASGAEVDTGSERDQGSGWAFASTLSSLLSARPRGYQLPHEEMLQTRHGIGSSIRNERYECFLGIVCACCVIVYSWLPWRGIGPYARKFQRQSGAVCG